MLKKMTFGTKLSAGFAVMLKLSAILSLTSWNAISTLKDTGSVRKAVAEKAFPLEGDFHRF